MFSNLRHAEKYIERFNDMGNNLHTDSTFAKCGLCLCCGWKVFFFSLKFVLNTYTV